MAVTRFLFEDWFNFGGSVWVTVEPGEAPCVEADLETEVDKMPPWFVAGIHTLCGSEEAQRWAQRKYQKHLDYKRDMEAADRDDREYHARVDEAMGGKP